MKVDHPQSFYDISWLAVKNGDPEEVMKILQLSNPQPSTWSMGLEAVLGDFWDFDEQSDVQFSRVFVTPKVNGWLLVIGGFLVGAGEEGVKEIAGYCERLSEVYGEACAFTSQGRMDLYSWVIAKDGKIKRMFEWDGDVSVDEGEPTPVERELRESDDDWAPSEVDVMTIAGEVSIDPGRLGPDMTVEGAGFLVTTASGRLHGIPQRQLHKGVTVFLSDDHSALEAGEQPAALSTEEVRSKISQLVPDIDWSQVGAGVSAAEHVEFVVGEEGELTSFRVFLCGGGDPLSLLSNLCEENGWSAVDDQSGEFLEQQNMLLT
jgi:hypothetical protein